MTTYTSVEIVEAVWRGMHVPAYRIDGGPWRRVSTGEELEMVYTQPMASNRAQLFISTIVKRHQIGSSPSSDVVEPPAISAGPGPGGSTDMEKAR